MSRDGGLLGVLAICQRSPKNELDFEESWYKNSGSILFANQLGFWPYSKLVRYLIVFVCFIMRTLAIFQDVDAFLRTMFPEVTILHSIFCALSSY